MAKPKKSDTCDHCGEPAHQRSEHTPERWSHGGKIHPLKNSEGITCIDCRYNDWLESRCAVVGVT